MDSATPEQKQLLQNFIKMFTNHRHEPIVFYGVGINTQFLLQYTSDYNIIGLMDAENIGKVIFGYQVLSMEDVVGKVKHIVVIARASYQKIIYKRISHLQKYNIEIHNLLGINLVNMGSNEKYQDNPYWNTNVKELADLIESHDVISFDIFDTLIMRKVLRPYNIFDIIEKELRQEYRVDIPFKEMRICAEESLKKQIPSPSLDSIYTELKKILPFKNKKYIMEKELEIEARYMTQRTQMVQLLLYARKKDKKIYLTSDMYLNRYQIGIILEKCMIQDYDEVILSNEYGKTKENGALFSVLKTKAMGKRILHIGDNLKSDIENANKYGIKTFYIMNCYEMLMSSYMGGLLANVSSVGDSLLLGTFAAKTLNSPFALNQGKSKVMIRCLEDIGYCYMAPLIMSFMIWFIKNIKDKQNIIILFSARDGYLIEKLYHHMCKQLKLVNMPKTKYFFTSRRAVTVAAIESEIDLIRIIDRTSGNFTLENLLKEKFGVEIFGLGKNTNISLPSQKEEVLNFILNYKDLIFENAHRERKNYLKYMKNNFDLDNKEIILFDFVSSGTISFHLKKILKKPIQLYCFATLNLPNSYYKDYVGINSFLGNSTSSFPKNSLLKNYFLWESVLTAPNPQLLYFDDSGDPVFAKNEGWIDTFKQIKKIHNGIIKYVHEIIELQYPFLEEGITPEFADYIWSLLASQNVIIPKEISDIFVFDSPFDGIEKRKIWDELF